MPSPTPGEPRAASTLIVTAHPDRASLTHEAARLLQARLGADASIADLAQERFDPRFTLHDRRAYVGRGEPDADVVAEQQRIDRAAHLALVFPVYWWSMPALLKGWIDRVFIAPWAFGFDEADKIVPALGQITAHLLPISGTEEGSFTRHGYANSFSTQVEAGILDFCGLQRGVTAFVYDSERADGAATSAELDHAVSAVVAEITGKSDAAHD